MQGETLYPPGSRDGSGQPRWGIVMTVREPAALVETNLRWHSGLGAAALHVFFDDPEDPAETALPDLPGLRAIRCDAGYWRRRRGTKGRPASQMRRQTINANHAQGRTDVDWLFHIDADEFMWSAGDLRGELADMPAGCELNLRVLERVTPPAPRHPFDGPFRAASRLEPAAARATFGEFAPMMKQGQYSHGAGKGGVPVGAGLRIGVHNAMAQAGDGQWQRAPVRISDSTRLLHYDGITPLHWALKFMRYALEPTEVRRSILQAHRRAQIDWMLERCDSIASIHAAHQEMCGLTKARGDALRRAGLLTDIAFDPLSAMGAADTCDFAAAFDADLLVRNPWAIEILGD